MAEKRPAFREHIAQELLKVDIPVLRGALEREARSLLKKHQADAVAGNLKGTNAWYEVSYKTFKDVGAPRSLGDFVQRVAFAYSWLATIPKGYPDGENFEAISKAIEQVAAVEAKSSPVEKKAAALAAMKARWDARAELATLVQSALQISTKHSVVAVSKVLHFWNPDMAPMTDANVALGLKALPRPKRQGLIIAHLLGGVRITKYLWYWEVAFHLCEDHAQSKGLSYRELDQLLFLLGQKTKSAGRVAKRRPNSKVKNRGAGYA